MTWFGREYFPLETSDKSISGNFSYPPITSPFLIPQGWQCPVCQKVHAPHVRSCDCNEHETISNNTLPLFWVK